MAQLPQDQSHHSDIAELVRQRYRSDSAGSATDWNETLALILGHKTTRAYLDKSLPDGTLELLVSAAQSAPTSSNLQLWSVVAVEDRERKDRLAQLSSTNPQIAAAPMFLLFIADLSRARAVISDRGGLGEGLDYIDTLLVAAVDAALAAQNLVIAANALGLGTCYIGAARNHVDAVAEEIGLPPETLAIFGLSVGYPDLSRASQVKPRLPRSVVLHRERYDSQAHTTALDVYNERLKSFQAEQAMPSLNWTDLVVNRLGTTAPLKGRVHLKDILTNHRGFKLD